MVLMRYIFPLGKPTLQQPPTVLLYLPSSLDPHFSEVHPGLAYNMYADMGLYLRMFLIYVYVEVSM